MRFGKLINGNLVYAPSTLTVDGRVHYHPGPALYEAAGYWPVIDTPHPGIPEETENPPYYVSRWEAQGGQIVKVWVEADPPEPVEPVPTLEDRVGVLEGKVGSLEVDYADKTAALGILGVST